MEQKAKEYATVGYLREKMLAGEMPQVLRLNGHLYRQGSSSAESLATMIVEGKHSNMFISWYSVEAPQTETYVVATYRVEGANILLDDVKLTDRRP